MNKTTFSRQPEQQQLTMTRTFDGPLALVWKAWTTPELLDRWWAPAPWKAETRSMSFRDGGRWLYSMNGPEGEQQWCKADYTGIVPEHIFEAHAAFCDDQGNDNEDLPKMHWHVRFSEITSGTEVRLTVSFPNREALEKIIEMGFEEGFTAAHGNLDELLTELKAEVRN